MSYPPANTRFPQLGVTPAPFEFAYSPNYPLIFSAFSYRYIQKKHSMGTDPAKIEKSDIQINLRC